MRIIPKPEKGEHPAYAEMYIKLLPGDGPILRYLAEGLQTVRNFIHALPPEKLLFRPAPDKWTIREILVHIVDDERIYAYRALCFARGEKQFLPGFEQDLYAFESKADKRDLDTFSLNTKRSGAPPSLSLTVCRKIP